MDEYFLKYEFLKIFYRKFNSTFRYKVLELSFFKHLNFLRVNAWPYFLQNLEILKLVCNSLVPILNQTRKYGFGLPFLVVFFLFFLQGTYQKFKNRYYMYIVPIAYSLGSYSSNMFFKPSLQEIIKTISLDVQKHNQPVMFLYFICIIRDLILRQKNRFWNKNITFSFFN